MLLGGKTEIADSLIHLLVWWDIFECECCPHCLTVHQQTGVRNKNIWQRISLNMAAYLLLALRLPVKPNG